MTKIEELKAAFDAATAGEWDFHVADNSEPPYSAVTATWGEDLLRHRLGVTSRAQHDVNFIALAHNMMPQLLGAVELLSAALPIIDAYRKVSLGDGDVTAMNIRVLLEKLK